jgi:hypothetical protein
MVAFVFLAIFTAVFVAYSDDLEKSIGTNSVVMVKIYRLPKVTKK